MPLRHTGGRPRRRLLLINQYFPPDASASAHLLGELAADLSEHHEVWVAAGMPSYNPSAGGHVPAGVHLLRARSTGFSRSSMAGRLANYVSFFLGAAINGMRVPRPDVIVTFTDPPVIGLLGAVLATIRRRPLVYVCFDIFPDVAIALGRLDHPILLAAWRLLNRIVRARATRIVVLGRDMRVKLEREGVPSGRIVVIPNWADETQPPAVEVDAVRREHGWERSFVVMHAGNVGLAQNLGTFVDAADRLRHDPRFRFVIMGDGAARRELTLDTESRGLSNVEFLPYRRKKEALAALAAADLHVVSLAPGLGGAVVPSKVYGLLALAKPFIAVVDDGSEIALLVAETGAGVHINPFAADTLADQIGDFGGGSLNREEFGARGRRAFESRYRREHATRRYLDLMEDVIARD